MHSMHFLEKEGVQVCVTQRKFDIAKLDFSDFSWLTGSLSNSHAWPWGGRRGIKALPRKKVPSCVWHSHQTLDSSDSFWQTVVTPWFVKVWRLFLDLTALPVLYLITWGLRMVIFISCNPQMLCRGRFNLRTSGLWPCTLPLRHSASWQY